MEVGHHALSEGTLIGDRFEVRSVLGVGGFGITYKGWDQHLACEVAIKEYLPLEFAARGQGDVTVRAHATRRDDYSYGLHRFLDEARTLARFKHPNVVRVVNFLESNGTAYLVMDYEEGESLGQYLKRTGAPLTEKQVRAIAEPILRGLAVVHECGFLHRDVKPGNIYLRRKGEPLLIDFGAARQALGEHSRSVTGIVSAGYAPPEQYSSDAKKQGPWTDLYGLGATLYRCISGEDPVDSPTRREAQSEGDPDPLRPATEVGRGRYAEALLTLVDRLLALSPKQRPGSAAEALKDLGVDLNAPPDVAVPAPSAAAQAPSPRPLTPEAAKAEAPSRNNTARWAAGLAALAAVAVLAVGASLGWFGRDEAAYEAAVRLEGEVKALSEKLRDRAQAADRERGELTRRTREVEDQLRVSGNGNEALRDEQTRAAEALAQAQTAWALRERLVHESPRRTELQGLLTLGSRQVQDGMFEEGRETLEKAKRGYGELITLDEAAETLSPTRAAAQAAQGAYETRTAGYDIPDGVQVTAARQALSQGDQHVSADRVVDANEAFERSQRAWGEALEAVGPEIARIDGERVAAGERAAAEAAARREQEAAAARARAEEAAAAEAARREQEVAAEREREQQERAAAAAEAKRLVESLGLAMVDIPASSFAMGSNTGEADQRPVHPVTVKAFRLSATEVTVAQFGNFVAATGYTTDAERNYGEQGCNTFSETDRTGKWRPGTSWRDPGFTQSGTHPVTCVSWNDAQAFLQWLREKTGRPFRLPSESEWEYAARAGSGGTSYTFGDEAASLCRYANVADQARSPSGKMGWTVKAKCNDGFFFTATAGNYAANAWGLYDMHGNVWEWTEDCYNASYAGAPADGRAWVTGGCKHRVSRGGGWDTDPARVRSAYRVGFGQAFRSANMGFRLAE